MLRTPLSSFAFPFKFFFVRFATRLEICNNPKHLGLIDIFKPHVMTYELWNMKYEQNHQMTVYIQLSLVWVTAHD